MASTSEYENEWGETIVHWSRQDNPFFAQIPVVHIVRAFRKLGDDEVTTPDTQCMRVFGRVRNHRVDMHVMDGPDLLSQKGTLAQPVSFEDMLPFDILAPTGGAGGSGGGAISPVTLGELSLLVANSKASVSGISPVEVGTYQLYPDMLDANTIQLVDKGITTKIVLIVDQPGGAGAATWTASLASGSDGTMVSIRPDQLTLAEIEETLPGVSFSDQTSPDMIGLVCDVYYEGLESSWEIVSSADRGIFVTIK